MKSAVLLISCVLAVSYSNALSPPKPDGVSAVKPSISILFPPIRCGPICRMFCPNGFIKNSKGCPICKCKPSKCPRFSLISCRSCKYGRTFVTDKNGCRRCRCKPRPVICPRRRCTRRCPNGYRLDSRGCNTCTCKPTVSRRSCRYGGKTYRHGTSYKIKCNTCFCRNGRSACSKKRCNTVCPKRKCRPCPLNLYRQDSKKCPTCICRQLNFPNFKTFLKHPD